MKKLLCILGFGLLLPAFAFAQQPDYKVVFDITSKDTMTHKALIRWLTAISNATPGAQAEVVYYGQSLDMVRNDRSVVAKAVQDLAKNKNIQFRVCAAAMKNHNIDKSQLLPGVETVPDGVSEIVAKQKNGWAYIKVSL